MSGFDCEFLEEPPKAFQSYCPICLLILREPFQVTCCGKSFCRQCIQRIKAGDWPCPTCNRAGFESFENKGLQQPLYGFQVFCSNKESGCDWQGELGQLDQHLNLNPDKDKLSVGCAYAEVKCLYCSEPRPRHEIEHHQTSECAERPFTCSLCEEYESTYADVVTNHSPVCKCRPVECPNSCRINNLQHQHLEEHVSTQCPLTYVECEFSDAGCDAKVYRKDLPSHLGENMVTHMSLLARENRKLKLQLKEQSVQLKEQSVQLKEQSVQLKEQSVQLEEQREDNSKTNLKLQNHMKLFSRVPPVVLCSDLQNVIDKTYIPWLSDPFYSHTVGGYKLQLEVELTSHRNIHTTLYMQWMPNDVKLKYIYRFNILPGESPVPPIRPLEITMDIAERGRAFRTEKYIIREYTEDDDRYSSFTISRDPSIFSLSVVQIDFSRTL